MHLNSVVTKDKTTLQYSLLTNDVVYLKTLKDRQKSYLKQNTLVSSHTKNKQTFLEINVQKQNHTNHLMS